MSDVLARICADKRAHVDAAKPANPRFDLSGASAPRGFKAALTAKSGYHIIAEIKKASPSKGILRSDFDPALHARQYEEAGAACLSVLTDTPYFMGQDDYLKQARDACALPALRKDFMIDEWQIEESRALGADCILLIMASLDDAQAQGFYDIATGLGMDVLIEIHDDEELDRTLDLDAPAAMIGVNNRNLKTLQVDLATGERLIRKIPDNFLRVGESGIHSKSDLDRLKNAGYQAFLIGESFMAQDHPGKALLTLIGEQS